MPDWKKEKKSRSVNDIPVEKKHDHIIHSLDDGDFQDLLSKVSQPTYCRSSSGYFGFKAGKEISSRETNALVKVCEQGLRDEDAARQEVRRKKAEVAFRNSRGHLRSCSRSISPEDRYKVNKPVEFNTMNIEYIDHEGDIEMTDLSGTAPPIRFTRGNREDTVKEFCQDDVELGNRSHYVLSAFPDPNEKKLQARGEIFSEHQTILPPQNEGMFSSFSYDMVGTDEIPNLTPSMMPLPNTAQKVHIPPNGSVRSTDDSKQQDNGKRDGIRKKKKKDKEAKNTFIAKDVPGYMGELPLDQLLNLIEGEPVPCESVKKQKGQQASAESEDPSRKGRRRKSKESKDNKEDAVTPLNVATIGNHQGKAPLAPSNQQQDVSSSVANKASVKETASATITTVPVGNNVSKSLVNNKSSPKRRKSNGPTVNLEGPAPARAGRSSTEDAEEEFLSADEGVALSPGGKNSSASAAVVSSDVMLDGANFRADDEDVSIIQITEEQEFITVSGKAKKKQTHQQTTRTGSAGKTERRSKNSNDKNELPRRNSLEERVSNKTRRPTTTSLADFMDEKKQENKTPAARQTTPLKRKVLRQERPESTADSENGYQDAPADEMAPTAVNGTSSPERAFSYADAAKKSSDQSRENSPTDAGKQTMNQQTSHTNTPSPTPAVEIVGTQQGTSGAELPLAPVSSTGGLSFFYDENEASNQENKIPADDGAFVLNLGGKTVRFAKGLAATAVEPDGRHLGLIELMTQRWENFNRGSTPIYYKPKTTV